VPTLPSNLPERRIGSRLDRAARAGAGRVLGPAARIRTAATAILFGGSLALSGAPVAGAAVEPQPLIAQARRVVEALAYLGSPLPPKDRQALEACFGQADAKAASGSIQRILDQYCLFNVDINPEERVAVTRGLAKPQLIEKGWRQFLVKVHNQAGSTAVLSVVSPNALSLFSGALRGSNMSTESDRVYRGAGREPPGPPYDRWLDLQSFDRQPLSPELSGLEVEYRIVALYSRDSGRREAKISFGVGQGSQDVGFRNEIDLLFECQPAHEVRLRILDENGNPTTASLLIRDAAGRTYPSPAKRLAPDFSFQPVIYRSDGERLSLPEGEYSVEFRRGPESLAQKQVLAVGPGTKEWSFRVARWIDPSRFGWWSGDHHIHAAGCAHYTDPTQGVLPADMERQCEGEDLKVGAVLTYGPCFDYQKQFFSGGDDAASSYPYLLHYDIEVSGFGSERSGHLCLLGLKDQMYPGATSDANWPTVCLMILRWAKAQGAVTGTAHSGWGLQPAAFSDTAVALSDSAQEIRVQSETLPNYVIPPFNGIGANEYVVDVTHTVPGPDGKMVPAVDFYSTVNTPYVWELNMWYHALNCGYRTRISGETDFPCIYQQRVGMGRSYVRMDGPLTYAGWCEGIRQGRSYVSDGKSHLMNFAANGAPVGANGSEIRLAAPGRVALAADVAALLPVIPDPALAGRAMGDQPYWDLERARIGATRTVPVEVVVNGRPVARKELIADGRISHLEFEVPVERSSWIALRILGSAHTNPFFVLVGDQPIRASRKSAEWCLKCVDQCWSQKQRFIRTADQAEALAAYEHARQEYRQRARQSEVD
jgi:hypothetical protein